MIIPPIQPQEWLEGYRGRLARLNRTPRLHLLNELRAELGGERQECASEFALLTSRATGASMPEIMMQHTLWPVTAVLDKPRRRELGTMTASQIGAFRLSHRERQRAWFCPVCATDESSRLFLSLWHTAHQMPGEVACNLHGCSLRGVEPAELLTTMPHEHLQYGDSAEHPQASLPLAPTVVLALEMLRRVRVEDIGFDADRCAQVLLDRVSTVSGPAPDDDAVEFLQERIADRFPHEWLDDAMPRYSGTMGWIFAVQTTLGRSFRPPTPITVAIVAATLFDDASSAIAALV